MRKSEPAGNSNGTDSVDDFNQFFATEMQAAASTITVILNPEEINRRSKPNTGEPRDDVESHSSMESNTEQLGLERKLGSNGNRNKYDFERHNDDDKNFEHACDPSTETDDVDSGRVAGDGVDAPDELKSKRRKLTTTRSPTPEEQDTAVAFNETLQGCLGYV